MLRSLEVAGHIHEAVEVDLDPAVSVVVGNREEGSDLTEESAHLNEVLELDAGWGRGESPEDLVESVGGEVETSLCEGLLALIVIKGAATISVEGVEGLLERSDESVERSILVETDVAGAVGIEDLHQLLCCLKGESLEVSKLQLLELLGSNGSTLVGVDLSKRGLELLKLLRGNLVIVLLSNRVVIARLSSRGSRRSSRSGRVSSGLRGIAGSASRSRGIATLRGIAGSASRSRIATLRGIATTLRRIAWGL